MSSYQQYEMLSYNRQINSTASTTSLYDTSKHALSLMLDKSAESSIFSMISLKAFFLTIPAKRDFELLLNTVDKS